MLLVEKNDAWKDYFLEKNQVITRNMFQVNRLHH